MARCSASSERLRSAAASSLCFGQTVGEGQSGHDDETLVADLAERLAHFADLLVDQAGQRLEPRFFALVAGEAILAPVDGDRNL